MSGNIWEQVLTRVETKVNRHSYYTWFKPTSFVADRGTSLHIRVPNALFRDWLNKHYSAVMSEALSEVHRQGCEVLFVTDEAIPPEELPPIEPAPEPEAPETASETGNLAPRYSFDTFIVGPSNQFAHAAS